MIVCHCRAVTDRAIRQSVRNGAADVEAIEAATGAGSCCGGCRPTVEDIVSGELGTGVPLAGPQRFRPLRLVSSSERAA